MEIVKPSQALNYHVLKNVGERIRGLEEVIPPWETLVSTKLTAPKPDPFDHSGIPAYNS